MEYTIENSDKYFEELEKQCRIMYRKTESICPFCGRVSLENLHKKAERINGQYKPFTKADVDDAIAKSRKFVNDLFDIYYR